MDNGELLQLQDEAYETLLTKLIEEDDPEKMQKLASAISQLEKGRTEVMKIEAETVMNQKKLDADAKLNQQKLEAEKTAREEDKMINEKQRKSDRGWKIFDGALALLGCAAGIALAFKTKSEEEDSYPKQPKTDMKASQLFDRAWKKNK